LLYTLELTVYLCLTND